MKVFILSTIILSVLSLDTHAETLRILNWEDYLHPRVIETWKNETGVDIEEIYFDSDEDRDEILSSASAGKIDIAVVDEAVSELFAEKGEIVKLDESIIPNLKHIDPFWKTACGQYTVPYMWGTLGIGYRSDKVDTAPQSWNALLKPDDSLKGHIGMLDDYRDMLAPALFVLGYSLNTDNKNELKAAFEYLKQQAPSVLTYEYAITTVKNQSEDAELLYMAMVYGGDQNVINEMVGAPGLWKYSVPREGTILWVDCLAAIQGSPREKLALEFINFLNRPDIAAINAESLGFATPNRSAIQHMNPVYRSDQSLFPSQEIMNRSQQYKVLEKQNIILRQRITSAIRKIHESN
jgi:spermidine/putrescine transport system substrate-binding protein